MAVVQQEHGLMWNETGIGFLPSGDEQHKCDYFDEYDAIKDTEVAHKLHLFRSELVKLYTPGRALDIGIGCGQFIETHGDAVGYDIDPASVAWLEERGIYYDPYAHCDYMPKFSAVTFWDSLEHIESPTRLLNRIGNQFVFVSIPIFRDKAHVLSSKHFKPFEHFWYFTEYGFVQWMRCYGFGCIHGTWRETELGRDSIGTFVFKRLHGVA